MSKKRNKNMRIRSDTAKRASINPDGDYEITDKDLRGYYIRVYKSGGKSYWIRTKIKGHSYSQKIAECQIISEKEAREKAVEYKQTLREGKKPQVLSAEIGQIETLLDLLERYIVVRGVELRESTAKDYRYKLLKFASELINKPAKDITAEEVESWYRAGKKTPIAVERTFTTIKTLLKFGANKNYIPKDITPSLGYIGRYKSEGSKKHIPLDSINDFMGAFAELSPLLPEYENGRNSNIKNKISYTARDYILFLLVTGLRKGEATNLKWKDVNFKKKQFDIPYNKAGRFMTVPMTSLTHDLLKWRYNLRDNKVAVRNKDDVYVFPSKGKKVTGGFSDPRSALRRISSLANFEEDINPHSLRDTFATYCNQLGISLDDTGKLLNHANRNITDSYVQRSLEKQRSDYDKVIGLIEDNMIGSMNLGEGEYNTQGIYNSWRVFFYGYDFDRFEMSPQPVIKDTYWNYLDY